jgi:ATP adenylyltransferase
LNDKDEVKKKREEEATTSGKKVDPFKPYDEDFFVADLSKTHVCLLNRFYLLKHHLLITTREFEDQESRLTQQDFEAMCICLAEFDGLAFYNAGKTAGASESHKHLQLVPLPLAPKGPEIPLEPLLRSATSPGFVGEIPDLPFRHTVAWPDSNQMKSPSAMLAYYQAMLRQLGLQNEGDERPGFYNLLATRKWMLIAPRSQESFDSIPVNAIGFAGTFLIRNKQQMSILKKHGPMTILKQVGVTRSEGAAYGAGAV